MSELRLALVLAMSVAIAPFALDAYLPAFPQMAAFLGVTVHDISLSVSVYIGALAIGQLTGGPLADRYGRQVVMLVGLAIFAAASLFISQTKTLDQLLLLRAVQAFSGGWVVVCVPALVRDRVRGIQSAKLFSLIGLMVVAAPALAPAIGGFLLEWQGWNSIFIFLFIYGVLVLAVLKLTVFSAPPPVQFRKADNHHAPLWRRYLRVLQTPTALQFIFLQASVFSAMMLFVTHASFIYQEHFSVTTGGFAALFGANVVVMAVMMTLNRLLLSHFSPVAILRGAVALQGIGVLLLLCATQLLPVLWLFAPAMMLSIGAIGAISPNAQAVYMENFSENGGTAAALMGATQFGVAGLVSAASSLLPKSIEAITLAQAACVALALLLAWWPCATKMPFNNDATL